MKLPTWQEANDAVIEGYADPLHAFINEHSPIDAELFRSDLQVLVDDLIQTETMNCAKHYVKIMRDAVEQAVLKEREDCANLCENVVSNEGYVQSKWCAKTIRTRGKK